MRLGHGGTDMKEMSPDAMDRAIACLQRMRRIAESHGVVALRAVATSATREAANADVFIRRASEEAQVEIEVISGLEEARLIHLGVLQAVPVFDKRALFVDIGGGSTEIIIGERGEMLAARSFKLGAVRLTDRFFPGGATTGASVTACREYVRSVLTHFDRKVETHGFEVAVGSSGTAETIARMVHAARGEEPLRTYNCFEFTAKELHSIVAKLCSTRTRSARAKLAGLEANRADIAPAGALILDEIMSRFGVQSMTFSEGALRDGVLLDTVERLTGEAAGPRHLPRRVASQRAQAARTLRRRSRALEPGGATRRRPVRRAAVVARPRSRRARLPRSGRAAGQRRAGGRPHQAPPALVLRDPQQRARRADRPRDRADRADRPLPPQERAQVRASAVRRARS